MKQSDSIQAWRELEEWLDSLPQMTEEDLEKQAELVEEENADEQEGGAG